MDKWKFWDLLAKKWKDVLDNYIRGSYVSEKFPNDLPYWHSERASTGFLAAAAREIDGAVAIEEYYTERVYSDTKKRSKGHCDLWVKYKDFSFSAEAKQLWPGAFKKEPIIKKIKEAEKQLRSLEEMNRKSSRCLFSVCFISPRLNDKAKFDVFLSATNNFCDNDSRIFHYDGRIWPDKIITWQDTGDKYPGVIMLVKEFIPNRR